MASNTGCSAGLFPITYLGLPIGSNMSLIANWKLLVDKFHSKLSSWKTSLLSYGGRLTLLKTVLGSLGGLTIGSLRSFNLALLHKWRWRFHSDRDSLWSKIIRVLHGSEGGFDQNGCAFNGIWSKIVGTSNYLHTSSILPVDSIRYQVGCGSTIRFWKDTWLGYSPLQFRYNRLFQLDRNEDCLISDRISNGLWEWNWSRDALGSRNTMYLNHLLTEISNIKVREGMDKCIWAVSQDDNFTVGSLRCLIDDHTLPSLVSKTTWEKFLPRKVNVFMWRLNLDRLPHRFNLSSRGIEISEISCASCNGKSFEMVSGLSGRNSDDEEEFKGSLPILLELRKYREGLG
ncbi:RNA-directed DNA polymerase, eukaryota, reverse transcriptase zinc-binding domain protein [Tanacetum coccineum]|uniref:RNA-directed DNA polymerase, eukaryota, reverse transcriptase zinc-binding domain protein n=1 Tax=Tanacetum coccineum TaxID=301880 RepID=A0ABQ5HG24_9ASTR